MTLRNRRITLKMLLAGVIGVAVALITAVAATGALTSDEPPKPPPVPETITAVPSEIADNYAIFRRDSLTTDRLTVPKGAGRPLEYGENLGMARKLGSTGYYAVPGEGSICMITSALGGVCGRSVTEPMVMTYGTCSAGKSSDTFGIVALVPDSITGGRVLAGDRTVTTLKAEDNSIQADLPRGERLQLVWDSTDNIPAADLPEPPGRMFCG
jgi:hypothetical protein